MLLQFLPKYSFLTTPFADYALKVWTEVTFIEHFIQAECLIENGAIVDQARDDGSTALHDACALGNPDIVTLLIRNGANVNKKDSTGKLSYI